MPRPPRVTSMMPRWSVSGALRRNGGTPRASSGPCISWLPARLTFVRDELVRHFGLMNPGLKPLKGLRVLDVGCGGGLVSEPLARMGACVVGLDPGRENVEAARAHVEGQTGSGGLDLTYRVGLVEELAAEGLQFDAVVSLEVVEHVPDVGAFVKTCASLVRPGGALVLSTINRNLKSYALAIVAAEYVLGWLPRGTHQWDRFVTPEELARLRYRGGHGVANVQGHCVRSAEGHVVAFR